MKQNTKDNIKLVFNFLFYSTVLVVGAIVWLTALCGL